MSPTTPAATDIPPRPPESGLPEGLQDAADLQAWARDRDEAAFARLVARHSGLVGAACQRLLGRGDAADEAAQAAFIVLARRAGQIRDPGRLGPWLYGTALRVCRSSLRAATRRNRHEQEAAMRAAESRAGAPASQEIPWSDLRPHLDAALASLSTPQREAVVCHLLEGRTQVEVARQLGVSEDAIRKRVDYALDKLRSWFARRGLAVTAVALAAGLATEGGAAEPALVDSCVQGGLHPAGPSARLAAAAERSRLAAPALAAALLLALLGAFLLLRPAPEPVPVRSQPVAPAADIPAASPPATAAAWLDADLGPIIAAFAAADRAGSDPVGVAYHLGGRWHGLRPGLRIILDGTAATATAAEIALTGAAPASPTSLLPLLSGIGRAHALPGPALRRLDPAALPARQEDEWARLSVGCDPGRLPRLSALLTDLFPYSALSHIRHPMGHLLNLAVKLRERPQLDRLAEAWSGDLTVVIAPGRERPRLSLVAGLRTAADPGLLAGLLAGVLKLEPRSAPAGAVAAWKAVFLDLPWHVVLAERRLVVTTADDPLPLLAPAAAPDDAHLLLEADFARIADGRIGHPRLFALAADWGLMPALPELVEAMVRDPRAMPPLADWLGVDGRHQPALPLRALPWRVAWTATADGARARESGPLILSTAIAACTTGLAGADAAAVTRRAIERREAAEAWMRHRARIAAIRAVRPYLTTGSPLPAEERAALRPWFAGVTPSDEQVRAFGTRHGRGGGLCTLVTGVHIPTTSSEPVVWENDGALLWSAPLGDDWTVGLVGDPAGTEGKPLSEIPLGRGWSAGIIGNAVGLLRSARPATAAAPAAGGF